MSRFGAAKYSSERSSSGAMNAFSFESIAINDRSNDKIYNSRRPVRRNFKYRTIAQMMRQVAVKSNRDAIQTTASGWIGRIEKMSDETAEVSLSSPRFLQRK